MTEHRPCACGCKLPLPAGAPARRRYATASCRLRAFRRTHRRGRPAGADEYADTLVARLRARVSFLVDLLRRAGVEIPPEGDEK